MKFRNRWINENNTEGKHPKEITAAIKSAWREEKREDKRTPYQKFRETTLKEKEAEWKRFVEPTNYPTSQSCMGRKDRGSEC